MTPGVFANTVFNSMTCAARSLTTPAVIVSVLYPPGLPDALAHRQLPF